MSNQRISSLGSAIFRSVFVLLVFATGCHIHDPGGEAEVSRTGQIVGSQESDPATLILIDLSNSLSLKQRERIPSIVAGIIASQGPSTTVEVDLLQTYMGNQDPLLKWKVPYAATMDETLQNQQEAEEQEDSLQEKVRTVLSWPRDRQQGALTSCYIGSAVFADWYFSHSAGNGRHRLFWVGDLIEDCPDKKYHKYRMPQVDSARSLASLDLTLDSLRDVDIRAVMIPVGLSEPSSEVPAPAIKEYWSVLEKRIGLAAGQIRIGTPSQQGIQQMIL